jgi:hypothetical protein
MKGKGGRKSLYLICSNDRLQTAFFCGTAAECAKILGMSDARVLQSAVCKKTQVFFRFAHVEKVPGVFVYG